jgi:hypothetical protein
MLEQLSNDYFEKNEKVKAMGMRNVSGLSFDDRKTLQFQFDHAKYERDKAFRALEEFKSKDT